MKQNDDRILNHIGKYGQSIRAVVEKQFFENGTCDHVISRLIREKRIVSEVGIPGGLNYYRLSLTEARARSFPEHRARPKKSAALREGLQVLWFCCMADKDRNRLERKQVREIFGDGSGSGKPHCAEADEDHSIVYRIYAPGPHSRDEYLLKCLRGDIEMGMRHGKLREWIEGQAFAFAVLVETPERKERLKRMISKTGPYEVRIVVEVVPGLSNLAAAIRKRGGESAKWQ